MPLKFWRLRLDNIDKWKLLNLLLCSASAWLVFDVCVLHLRVCLLCVFGIQVREMLVQFYTQYFPDRLASVDSVMEQYAGREDEVVELVKTSTAASAASTERKLSRAGLGDISSLSEGSDRVVEVRCSGSSVGNCDGSGVGGGVVRWL